MSQAETIYTFRDAYPDVLQRGRACVVTRPVYRDGALVAPTASGSTFTLLNPSGVALVDAQPVTVTDSIARYSLSSTVLADTLPLGEGYQQVWRLVLPDGTTRTTDRETAIALRPLHPVITDDDLKGDYPLMDRDLPQALTSWQPFIDQAWKEIVGRLSAEGHFSYLIKSAYAFRRPHMELAHAKRFRALAAARPSQVNYLELQKQHHEAYEAAWKAINWTSDDDHDGRVDDPAKRRAGGSGVLHINVPPTRHPWRVTDPRW